MATLSDSLQYAMVAFSALIYSIKKKSTDRSYTFEYYGKALREFHILLSKNPRDMDTVEKETALATALSLLTIEVASN
jgi:hypothetical protein